MPDTTADRIRHYLDANRARAESFLAELVKVPSDNPPGDCAAHARRAEALLAELGLAVEPHPVPEALVRAHGMVSCTNLLVRRTLGAGGPTLALDAHAAMPFTGVGALEAATTIPSALYRWRKGLAERVSATPGIGSPQLTVGLIKGGINTNVVPDRVTFRLDRRMIPEENPAEVEAELRELIAAAVRDFPKARVEVRRILLSEPLTPLPGGQRLAEALC